MPYSIAMTKSSMKRFKLGYTRFTLTTNLSYRACNRGKWKQYCTAFSPTLQVSHGSFWIPRRHFGILCTGGFPDSMREEGERKSRWRALGLGNKGGAIYAMMQGRPRGRYGRYFNAESVRLTAIPSAKFMPVQSDCKGASSMYYKERTCVKHW